MSWKNLPTSKERAKFLLLKIEEGWQHNPINPKRQFIDDISGWRNVNDDFNLKKTEIKK